MPAALGYRECLILRPSFVLAQDLICLFESRIKNLSLNIEACRGYFGIRDIGLFLRDTGIFVFFILGYGIFRNFGIGVLEFILGYELN